MNGWQIAGGSVTGTMHLKPVKFDNNQDAFYWVVSDEALVAVVSDGCGSGEHSEVGAKVGCRLVARQLAFWLDRFGMGSPSFIHQAFREPFMWEVSRANVVDMICDVARGMGSSFHQTIRDFFLFTVNGVLMTRNSCVLFSIGDGFSMLNGSEFNLGEFPGDAPPYMMYSPIQDTLKDPTPELYKFQIHAVWLASCVRHVVIGSDGVGKYLMPALNNDISEFWTDDKYFQNPDQIRRSLAVINKTNFKVRGPLRDDTTLIVIRRIPEG